MCWQGKMHLGTLEMSLRDFDEELCFRVFQSVRGLVDDSVTRWDKNEDMALEMRDLTELHWARNFLRSKETSSDANIAQVDCVPAWLGEFRG